MNRTAEAVNMCQRHSAALQKQFRDAHALAKDAHAKAKKDNDSIYFDRVPPYATLRAERRAWTNAALPNRSVSRTPAAKTRSSSAM